MPSEAGSKGIIAANTIITGIPKLTTSKTDFIGFILVPIMIGNVTTFSLIPLIEIYDVYELRDENSSQSFLIAHSKGTNKLPEKIIIVAGVLKELKANKNEKKASKMFLEAVYHMGIN
ncbi:hypothetical protein PI23P_08290 [Polaribacter irgensii 23-P]|uniref:Uncharacterized protein n=1 Tax=Polaribacter irgensii 23-P TaxID=313594 RepID=A4BZL7_9FLAO|nr:hypothetical protein [Polaribacter irgensii]EAR12610.1 hypothetical protein PI23P_08290 [Polaribacter irgensii 23-P]